MLPFPFIGYLLTSEFTLLDEPTKVSEVAAITVFLTDGPEFIGSKRQIEPRDSTRKFKLPIVRSIS
jgi:hypothetical protein